MMADCFSSFSLSLLLQLLLLNQRALLVPLKIPRLQNKNSDPGESIRICLMTFMKLQNISSYAGKTF